MIGYNTGAGLPLQLPEETSEYILEHINQGKNLINIRKDFLNNKFGKGVTDERAEDLILKAFSGNSPSTSNVKHGEKLKEELTKNYAINSRFSPKETPSEKEVRLEREHELRENYLKNRTPGQSYGREPAPAPTYYDSKGALITDVNHDVYSTSARPAKNKDPVGYEERLRKSKEKGSIGLSITEEKLLQNKVSNTSGLNQKIKVASDFYKGKQELREDLNASPKPFSQSTPIKTKYIQGKSLEQGRIDAEAHNIKLIDAANDKALAEGKPLVVPGVGKYTPIYEKIDKNPLNHVPYTVEHLRDGLENVTTKSILGSLLDKSTQFLNNLFKDVATRLPNYAEDSLMAIHLGLEVRPKFEGTLTENFNNIMGISSTQGEYAKEYIGVDRITGRTIDITGLSEMTDEEIELFKKMHIEETAKSVRGYGKDINPFGGPKFGDTLDKPVADLNKTSLDHAESLKLFKQQSLHSQVRKLIEDSNKAYGKKLKAAAYHAKHGTERSKRKLEKAERKLKDLSEKKKKVELERDKIDEEIKQEGIKPKTPEELKENLRNHERGMALDQDGKWIGLEASKTNRPGAGLSGYGLGFKALSASSGEHLARAAHYFDPRVFGPSIYDSMKENLGIMTSRQKLMYSRARGFAKLPHLAMPLIAGGFVAYGAATGDSTANILTYSLGVGAAQHGWRFGSALGAGIGGAITGPTTVLGRQAHFKKINMVGKGIGLGVGGLIGGALGFAAIGLTIQGIDDMTSNDSAIRKFASKAATREIYDSTPQTSHTLTASQAALSKLARSGLNDRGQLLGNEALVLQGIL